MRYAVVVEQADRSFGAYVPDLPGCVAAAASRQEVLALMREAIDLHLQALREKGELVPAPTSTTEYVEI